MIHGNFSSADPGPAMIANDLDSLFHVKFPYWWFMSLANESLFRWLITAELHTARLKRAFLVIFVKGLQMIFESSKVP